MNKEQEMVRIACKAIDDKKAIDIKVIDIHEVSVIADYFIIASGNNLNQVQAIVDNVEEQLGRAGYEPKQVEGTRGSKLDPDGLRRCDHPCISMKKIVFSMIWNESGEMEKNWMSADSCKIGLQ